MTRGGVAAALILLASCGPPPAAGPRGPEPHAAPRRTSGEPRARAPRESGRPYASTPITAIAEDLTDLATAVIAGRPAPTTAAPLRSPLDGVGQTAWHTEPPVGELVIIGIAFELELILKRGEPEEDAEPRDRWGSLRLTLALSRNGLRVYSLQPRTMSRALPGGPLPAPMSGLATVASELLTALRRGDLSAYALDDGDRTLLGNDEVWLQVQQDRVSPELVTAVQAMLATLPDAPLAYRLDDVAVLAADADERLLSLAMSWDAEGERFVLATEPLVEVRQLWPR